ncbi:iron hydrogenase [Schizosaccharomyces japonicus yFS275]|uniref:Cytosolic Fe-S cluster assembly factor NAR1 homolog n=1 Tax=Schizosaccharomyces japonicus (strain yFS275 / FY16936) TaxID=402676 RepID=NAR1_SCHJY|nr:iron hydrogenase [Schizosaccharomyces japonicus yFS275]B6K2N0.1 RecName: Full=Cytosolic Fe-S cluster assembly factor NAR1 homolog; AltName: Full=Nuclear architecture-related protein 1 homolog [Schizosaccharomyces japonicus yFS275]EEB07411.1 iron hydrogenase [Schizosaccharomyces japonicus yFS275]
MVKLSAEDLNDYLNPGVACVKPVKVQKKQDNQQNIKVNGESYYEVTKDTGEVEELGIASISLNDCLACSGCITSAESVLINLQSYHEVLKFVNAKEADDFFILQMSPQARASLAAYYNLSVQEVQLWIQSVFTNELKFNVVVDTGFSREISLRQAAIEFCQSWVAANAAKTVYNSKSGEVAPKPLPVLSSSCPGWICYVEKTHSSLIPHISTVRSPQQVAGRLLKDWFSYQLGISRKKIWVLSLMPCFDKKLEASRNDFVNEQVRDVDCVITPKELVELLKTKNISPQSMDLDSLSISEQTPCLPSWYEPVQFEQQNGSSSGGYLHYIMTFAAKALFDINDLTNRINVSQKNADMIEYELTSPDTGETLLRMATCYGFRNIQNLVRNVGRKSAPRRGRVLLKRMKNMSTSPSTGTGKQKLDYVEVMACPGGCINGGGQLPPPESSADFSGISREWMRQVEAHYFQPGVRQVDNAAVDAAVEHWLPSYSLQQSILHTKYHAVQNDTENPVALANTW